MGKKTLTVVIQNNDGGLSAVSFLFLNLSVHHVVVWAVVRLGTVVAEAEEVEEEVA